MNPHLDLDCLRGPVARVLAAVFLSAVLAARISAADAVATATAATTTAAACPQTCATFRVRPQDAIWAVNTRSLGCPTCSADEPGWTLCRYESQTWKNATSAEFYATDSADVVTVFYIHGNRIDSGLALQDGLHFYFQMAGKFDGERPVRVVIWSWPSEQVRGLLNDVRSKAARSTAEGYYLGRFLAGFKPDVPVGLVGYSYGARIVCGALHGLGGGNVVGCTLAGGQRPPMRVALWAAAENHDWLLPGRFHGQALGMADRWQIVINSCDPVLQRYRFLEKCSDPAALGYCGFYGRNLLPADLNRRIEEMHVEHLVGRTHDNDPYLYALPIQNRTRDYVLWHVLDGAAEKRGEQVASAGARGR